MFSSEDGFILFVLTIHGNIKYWKQFREGVQNRSVAEKVLLFLFL